MVESGGDRSGFSKEAMQEQMEVVQGRERK